MSIRLLICLFTIGISFSLYSQRTILVREGNVFKMHKDENDEWVFNDHLKSGHYASYEPGFKNCRSKEITYKNGLKNGLEKRYYACSDDIYLQTNWVDGKKEGEEFNYGTDGRIDYVFTYKNNLLDGPFTVYRSQGIKKYSGFYKGGYRDSVWTYYDDSLGMPYQQYVYRQGKEYLLNLWGIDGQQVINGNGVYKSSGAYSVVKEYKNGLLNGRVLIVNNYYKQQGNVLQTITGSKQVSKEESVYIDGVLAEKTCYYGDTAKETIRYCYTQPAQVDTVEQFVDSYITNVYCYEIQENVTPVLDGFNTKFFKNGVVAYAGSYDKGKRYGNWLWNYYNGKKRIEVNYDTNTWAHYDTLGNVVSTFPVEWLTFLTRGRWNCNGNINSAKVDFTDHNNLTVTPQYTFDLDGTVTETQFLECGKDIGRSIGTYYLIDNKLIFSITNYSTKTTTYKFRITAAGAGILVLEKEK